MLFEIFSRLNFAGHPYFGKLHFCRSIANSIAEDKNLVLLYYESEDHTKAYYSRCGSRDDNALIEHRKLEFPFRNLNGYLRIVGSGNGLVCLIDTNYFSSLGILMLWNPIFKKFERLPDSCRIHRFRSSFSHMVVGFMFVPKINDFRIVQILYSSYVSAVPDVLVYSLEVNSWRKVKAIAPCYMPNKWSSSVVVNGEVHWLAYKRPKASPACDSIMAFNMAGEVFRMMALPTNLNGSYDEVHLSVSASGESLSVSFHFDHRWEVWLMKNYGVAESWMIQFSILEGRISLPLNFMDSGNFLLVAKNGKLVSHNPETEKIQEQEMCGPPSSFRLVACSLSLALVDGGDNSWSDELSLTQLSYPNQHTSE
ncbi:hypothetical protein NMG60_11022757 [Bertholletia excelsa]